MGKKVMDGWTYQSQSSLELVKQVYLRDDFDPETRLHALLDEQLVGFQTSKILPNPDGKHTIGRMEFPIADPQHHDVVEQLEKQTELILTRKGATRLRVRVSPHWGRTVEYAKHFGFSFEKPHLMTTEAKIDQLKTTLNEKYAVIHLNPSNDLHKSHFRKIFPLRYPMRYDEEVDEWFQYYMDQNPVVWLLLTENDKPIGHLIGFDRDGTVALTAFFTTGNNPKTELQSLVSKTTDILRSKGVEALSLSIGDNQIPYVDALIELGLDLETKVSYYTKDL